MKKEKLAKAGSWAAGLFYAAIALEVIIMITPFAAYFYSIYAPVLGVLEARPSTAWLTAFFLPHVSYTGDPVLMVLAYLGPALLGLGLAIFLVGAFQVYSAKLLRRGVVSGGIYRLARHPQYAGLAIAGAGLLLYWPRFIILVSFVVMLFVYHFLARHEERLMEDRHGEGYRDYAASLPMFVPRWLLPERGRRAVRAAFASPARATASFAVVLIVALGLASGLRAYSVDRLTVIRQGNLTALSLTGGGKEALEERLRPALSEPAFRERLARHPSSHGLVAYVLPREYMMQHLLADLSEHESHHGGEGESGLIRELRHLGQMYVLRPLRQLRSGGEEPDYRIIVAEALTPAGESAGPERVLDPTTFRYPLFFADVEDGRVAMTMDTPPRHTWGTLPVPAF